MVAPEHRLYAGDQLLGIKGFDDIGIRAELEPQDLIKSLSLGREHNDRSIPLRADLPADFISVLSGKHEIEEDQIRLKALEVLESLITVLRDLRFEHFLLQIERN